MNTELPKFDAFWNYADPADTELRFREVLPLAEASGDNDYHAQLLTQIARTQGLRRQFDEAHATLDTAAAMVGEHTPIAAVRLLLERGRTFNSSGKQEIAMPLFRGALDRAVAAGLEFHAVDAAHMLGIAAPVDERLSWNLHAVELAERASLPRAKGWLGALYNNIGWTFFEQKNYDSAEDYFRRNEEWCNERNLSRESLIARWSIAKARRMKGFAEEALGLQLALLIELESEGGQDGYVFEELGECLLALGRADEAAEYFGAAHQLLSQDIWMQHNEAERLERMRILADAGKEEK